MLTDAALVPQVGRQSSPENAVERTGMGTSSKWGDISGAKVSKREEDSWENINTMMADIVSAVAYLEDERRHNTDFSDKRSLRRRQHNFVRIGKRTFADFPDKRSPRPGYGFVRIGKGNIADLPDKRSPRPGYGFVRIGKGNIADLPDKRSPRPGYGFVRIGKRSIADLPEKRSLSQHNFVRIGKRKVADCGSSDCV